MCTFSLVEFGSSEKFVIYLFLQNVRTKMNDIIVDVGDMWASDSKNYSSGENFQKSLFCQFSFHGIWTTWICKKNAFRSTPYGLFCRIYKGDLSQKVVKIGEKMF